MTYYAVVGVKDDVDFIQTVAQAWRLEDLNPRAFTLRSFALPNLTTLHEWARAASLPVADELGRAEVLVFRNNELIGNTAGAIKLDLKQAGLKWMLQRPHSSSSSVAQEQPSNQEDDDDAPPTATTLPPPLDNNEQDLLPIQLELKSEIVTGYRVNPDKQFTNYKPFANHLVQAYHWQYMAQAPLPAGVVLVQDQTTAATVANKYPKALLNNIGWGGQSCLGGTKGTQLACRAAKALQDGCDYEQLQIQPNHYRLWVAEECHYFFNDVCQEAASEELFIQKPSGGQHGVGIKVHQGCSQLRASFPDCNNQAFMFQHKYFISPYITPVLLDGYKFDMRTFALIASLDPLLCFYADGFVRKATTKFTTSNLKDSSAHVTNSLSQDLREDHFWDFAKLNAHLNANSPQLGRDFVFQRFRNRAKKVTEFFFRAAQHVGFKRQRGRFQVFAADWIVDDKGHAYLLEVNSNPLVASTPPKGLELVFPKAWGELMDLVLQVQTGKPGGRLEKARLVPYKYVHGSSWHLVLNHELRPEYNTCQALKPQERNTRASEIMCPSAKHDDAVAGKRTCVLAQGTEDETVYHIVHSDVAGPTVVVLAGLHGKESAGVIAARYVAAHLAPKRGTLVVVERANARGVHIFKRYVPASTVDGSPSYDLNRAFNSESVLSGKPLVIALWKLLLNVQPDYYFDLHEGRAFFAAFLVNYHHTLPQTGMIDNVGATTGAGSVSKGNSIVTSVNAYALAQQVANSANERIIERRQKIFVMGPPIEGGLAAMLSKEFQECKIMLFESTQTNELEDRAKQHLFMLSVALKSEEMLDEDFNADAAQVEPCVATREGCDVAV